MELKLQLKRLGKKKIIHVDITLAKQPTNLRELIEACVLNEIKGYNENRELITILPFLGTTEISEQSQKGKISFGDISNTTKVDKQAMIYTALLAFEDGLFVVFIDDYEISDLAATLVLNEHSVVSFIRMTFLSGTYW
ncbi:MAG: hypothetical protein ACJAV1_003248 [Paraglaciecola sp.]|jgi:hypothetical protein